MESQEQGRVTRQATQLKRQIVQLMKMMMEMGKF